LVEGYETIPREYRESEAHSTLMEEAAKAQKAIDKARGELLDTNFEALGDDISRWWNLLRPDEPIRFSKIKRRGTGMRHVDLTALLSPEPASDGGVERHAAGVFSDSQLNALGLSIFLARAMRAGAGFVVLDDPVPASDEEHQAVFADKLIQMLLDDDDVQVLLTTHDHSLYTQILQLHGHRSINHYQVTLDIPASGSKLLRKTGDLKSAIDDIRNLVDASAETELRNVSNKCRIAAERFCKEILFRHGGEAKLSGLSRGEKTLGGLVPLVAPYLNKNGGDKGKLQQLATVTNPAAHDDCPPSRPSLKVVVGNLGRLYKDYLAS
jgi:hypothetical protein